MSQFFEFEADFVESLRCIPMQVRLKLDTCGIKLKLPQWHQFSQNDRALLVELPCVTPAEVAAYRTTLQNLVRDRVQQEASELAIDPAPEWLNLEQVPDSVQQKSHTLGMTLTLAQWANLTPAQRFALIKLSRSGHENHNFLPALKEFHLVDADC
jgi:hypothetical protein